MLGEMVEFTMTKLTKVLSIYQKQFLYFVIEIHYVYSKCGMVDLQCIYTKLYSRNMIQISLEGKDMIIFDEYSKIS